MAYSIRSTVVEIPARSESMRARGLPGYTDLVPWADPYIASLVEKVQREGGRLLRKESPRAECPPPPLGDFSPPAREGFNWDWPSRGRG